MEFNKVIEQRYSVRAYQSQAIEKDKLNEVLEAARIAPTAANRQPFKIIVIETKGREAELKRIYGKKWFVEAPIVIGVCAVTTDAWVRREDGANYGIVDATIIMDHLILAATNLGLGTCWVGAFDPVAVREILELPENVELVAFTPLGYPADKSRPKKRKELIEIIKYEKW